MSAQIEGRQAFDRAGQDRGRADCNRDAMPPLPRLFRATRSHAWIETPTTGIHSIPVLAL
jgi:hypothetical protein